MNSAESFLSCNSPAKIKADKCLSPKLAIHTTVPTRSQTSTQILEETWCNHPSMLIAGGHNVGSRSGIPGTLYVASVLYAQKYENTTNFKESLGITCFVVPANSKLLIRICFWGTPILVYCPRQTQIGFMSRLGWIARMIWANPRSQCLNLQRNNGCLFEWTGIQCDNIWNFGKARPLDKTLPL